MGFSLPAAGGPWQTLAMPPTRQRYLVLTGLCLAASLAYLTRNGVGPAESTIRADLGLTKEQSGWLMSMFFWPYALCQIPAAELSRRIGVRRALPLFAGIWSLATMGLAMGQLMIMAGARALMGIGQAGLVPASLGAISRWFPRQGQAFPAGAFGGFMSVGSIVAAPLTAWLLIACGWRWMFVIYAIPGVLWAIWFRWMYRNSPAENPAVNEAERSLIAAGEPMETAAAPKAATPWRSLLTHPAMACLCAQQFCRAAGYIFFATWFATYLQEARGVTIEKSGWLTALPLMGDFAGSLVGGFLSDRVLRKTGNWRLARQGLTIVALVLSACLIVTAWFVAHPIGAVGVISAGMFCAALANPCASAVVMHTGGRHVATVSATMNMCGNFGAAAFPLAVPVVLKLAGSWDAVLFAFAGLYLVAAVFWFLMKPRQNAFDGV